MTNRVAGLVLAVLLAACVFLGWRILDLTRGDFDGDATRQTTTTTSNDATEAFLNAWRRNDNAEYRALVTTGVTGDEARATTQDIVVRRNGQLLLNRNGTIIYQRNGISETCRQTPSDLFCTPFIDVPTNRERHSEIRALVDGDTWSYRVDFGPVTGCFDLRLDLARGLPTDEFGILSSYCFDAATGALRTSRVERVNRTRTYQASDISDVLVEEELQGLFPEPILDLFLQ